MPAGSGWPGDPALPDTAGRDDAGAGAVDGEAHPHRSTIWTPQVSVCRACPRLVEWRERVAVEKRRSYADEPYWGRPVPGFGVGARRGS